MNRRIKTVAAVSAGLTAALSLTACGSNDSGSGGGGDKLVVAVDLPFTGSSADTSNSTYNAIALYLEQMGGKVGDYNVELRKYDNATATAGKWDASQCKKNAGTHVATDDEVAVIGPYNSGCAAEMIPVMNQDENGPMLLVSDANTAVGLTKKWDVGEPDKYYPTGTRNYARVVTTDDYQGAAGAQFAAKDLHVSNCLVLNDTEVYGKGVAKTFAAELDKQGVQHSDESWTKDSTNYNALFNRAKGVDCVYFGGVFDNNGAQLLKDKVRILGDNSQVKVITPDGWTGYPDLDKMPEAEGIYGTFPGLPLADLKTTAKVGTFLKDYQAKYGKAPTSAYALYGTLCFQIIAAAIEQSDGTRADITAHVLGGEGITIPKNQSMVGKEIDIDPATGDVNAVDMTIQQITGGEEKALKGWIVQ